MQRQFDIAGDIRTFDITLKATCEEHTWVELTFQELDRQVVYHAVILMRGSENYYALVLAEYGLLSKAKIYSIDLEFSCRSNKVEWATLPAVWLIGHLLTIGEL